MTRQEIIDYYATERDCGKCGMSYTPGKDPDPCLGVLPGVKYACCGHGGESSVAGQSAPYVMFENGVIISGDFGDKFMIDTNELVATEWEQALTARLACDKVRE